MIGEKAMQISSVTVFEYSDSEVFFHVKKDTSQTDYYWPYILKISSGESFNSPDITFFLSSKNSLIRLRDTLTDFLWEDENEQV
jgi:hypothetical protein